MDNKTVLTVQEQKKEKRYLWLDFFKFLFFQVSGLSKIKYLFFLIAIGLIAFPTIGIPSLLYEKFKEDIVLEKLGISLGALLASGYIAAEILVYFLVIKRLPLFADFKAKEKESKKESNFADTCTEL